MNAKLNHKGFEPYLIRRTEELMCDKPAVQYIFRFDNNYGASVVKNIISDGYECDLWKLAVINFYDDSDYFDLDYRISITSDVEGCLTDWEVRNLLGKIKAL